MLLTGRFASKRYVIDPLPSCNNLVQFVNYLATMAKCRVNRCQRRGAARRGAQSVCDREILGSRSAAASNSQHMQPCNAMMPGVPALSLSRIFPGTTNGSANACQNAAWAWLATTFGVVALPIQRGHSSALHEGARIQVRPVPQNVNLLDLISVPTICSRSLCNRRRRNRPTMFRCCWIRMPSHAILVRPPHWAF